ncbi:MAG: bifunctional hydroxymethylpyrimidine kinase/phosphomethylpyrimidine kinase [Hornefia sp.]|nr:bifunctional hydroxymethylpyrimidine kinase/phosphomethylpyrimidine kinase [Hornefia sp.]
MKKNIVLTIAGSDCGGGAGVQADIKTMTVNGVYAASAITALTAQNTMGVTAIMEVTSEFLEKELDAVLEDFPPDAVKIGMVSSSELICVIASKLLEYRCKNIVVDPVMLSTSGAKLISDDAVSSLCSELIPIAAVITPNIPEACALSGIDINSHQDMMHAADLIWKKYGAAVLIKGGHGLSDANDFLFDGKEKTWFYGKRIENPNTHGTGCTLSSAIASNLAKGLDLKTSIENSKNYISKALGAMLDLGKGPGPMDHAFNLIEKDDI